MNHYEVDLLEQFQNSLYLLYRLGIITNVQMWDIRSNKPSSWIHLLPK